MFEVLVYTRVVATRKSYRTMPEVDLTWWEKIVIWLQVHYNLTITWPTSCPRQYYSSPKCLLTTGSEEYVCLCPATFFSQLYISLGAPHHVYDAWLDNRTSQIISFPNRPNGYFAIPLSKFYRYPNSVPHFILLTLFSPTRVPLD